MISTRSFFCLVAFLVCCSSSVRGTKCNSPVPVTYSTLDATILTNVAYIAEFQLDCPSLPKGFSIFAQVGDQVIPAVKVSDNGKFQLSWVEDAKKAKSKDYEVKLFDDEGYANLKKAFRNSEDGSSVEFVTKFSLYYPRAYQGPWLNSEFLAAVLSIGVWYFAFSAKSKLLA